MLELDGDLYVAVEDGRPVSDDRNQYASAGEEYVVALRGPRSSERTCTLAEQSAADETDRCLHRWKNWDMGYNERPPVEAFTRCFRSGSRVSKNTR